MTEGTIAVYKHSCSISFKSSLSVDALYLIDAALSALNNYLIARLLANGLLENF